ncbi:hypothetical protein TKK_0004099 [Trichogramma kaykai]
MGRISKILSDSKKNINFKNETQRRKFLQKIRPAIENEDGSGVNLREIFEPNEIDWLLKEAITHGHSQDENNRLGEKFLDFVIRTGYKDEPAVDRRGKPICKRTTSVQMADWNANIGLTDESIPIVVKLFKVYDKFHVNYTDANGPSHFHVASMYGIKEVVERFLNSGQDPNVRVKRTQDTPLHLACSYGRWEVFELLLRRGANANLRNNTRSTPMHIICLWRYEVIERWWWEICDNHMKKFDLNVVNNLNWTPLKITLLLRECPIMTGSLLRLGPM